jgi:hypothetical protein
MAVEKVPICRVTSSVGGSMPSLPEPRVKMLLTSNVSSLAEGPNGDRHMSSEVGESHDQIPPECGGRLPYLADEGACWRLSERHRDRRYGFERSRHTRNESRVEARFWFVCELIPFAWRAAKLNHRTRLSTGGRCRGWEGRTLTAHKDRAFGRVRPFLRRFAGRLRRRGLPRRPSPLPQPLLFASAV